MLKSYCISELAREMAENLRPSESIKEAENLQGQTSQMMEIIAEKGPVPFFAIHNISTFLKHSKIGGTLKASELLKISDNLTSCHIAKSYIAGFEDKDILLSLTEEIISLKSLKNEIDRCIISDEEISDDASSQLKDIRRKILSSEGQIREKLRNILNSATVSKYLQDNVITTRSDRFVLPVKSENRANFPGIVHDSSSSGATLFIEPMSIVNLNNKISRLKKEESIEIQRILASLSAIVAEEAETIEKNQQILVKLDFINAKGQLGANQESSIPHLIEGQSIKLKNARHPLLNKDTAVPLTIYFGEDEKQLIITGPNTGGKTVALKTIGLMAAMAGSGLAIPAKEGSQIPIFDGIYADIGDSQSIEQSLSTFSSHMTNTVDILKSSTKNSLVIFDELGAGTDPVEGAALAVSILENLREKGCLTCASTHYSELKNYALNTDGVINASMEFDIKTLMPTYKLIVGIPGKSNAFEISKRLGLDDKIIERAKSHISEDMINMEDTISKLANSRKAFEDKNEELDSLINEQKLENARLKGMIEKQRTRDKKALEEAKAEARKIIKSAKHESEHLIEQIRELKKDISCADDKKIQNLRDSLRTASGKYERDNEGLLKKAKEKPDIKSLEIGDEVFVPTFMKNGKIIAMDDSKKNIKVQVGQMSIDLKRENIEPAKIEEKKSKGFSAPSIKTKSVSPDLDLRGMDLENALIELDKYLDDAAISGLSSVTIIHGLGTGVLKEGVETYLRKAKNIASFSLEPRSRGGATTVVLK